MDAYLDSGAYGGFRPGAVVGGIAHAGGCYRAQHSRISVSRVYTNNIPGGQMRAPGEPQGFFAAESHMDCVARRLGMDPLNFRLKNLIEEGESTLTGGHYRGIKAKETLKAAVKAAAYSSPKAPNVGRGIAMGYRGPGAGNTSLKIVLNPDGSVFIHTSLFEQGTGTYTTMRQIVAEELNCDPDGIRINILDTDAGVSFDSGIGGSRGTRVASGAAFRAARAAKEELLGLAEKLNRDDDHAPMTAFAAQVAEVFVDRETGEVTLRSLTTAHDTGAIMNPVGHQGQIEGGVVQGIGYGLIEYLPVEEGRVGTAHFGEYKIPTAKDIPELKTVLVKGEDGVGPYKTKGIGENPISPVAPAIANAIEDAVGVRIRDLPITAEKIYAALHDR